MALCFGALQIILAVDIVKALGKLLYIVAMVAVLRELYLILAEDELAVARVDGGGKLLYLVAGVVDIELAPDVVARAVEYACERVAQHAAAGVAHVHGAGGVCGDELDHALRAVSDVHAAVILALSGDVLQHVAVPALTEAEVDEAGAGDLDGVEPRAIKLHVRRERFGDLARRHVQHAGAGHGVVCGIVAVGGVLGYLNAAAEHRARGQLALFYGLLAGLVQNTAYLLFCVMYQICHCCSLFCSVMLSLNMFRLTTVCSMSTT